MPRNALEDRHNWRVTFAAIAEAAPQLRAAGVLKVTVDGVTVELAPYKPEEPSFDMTDPNADEKKPKRGGIWNDAALYGRDEDAPIPGLKEK